MRLKLLLANAYPQAEHDTDAMAKVAYFQKLLNRAVRWSRPVFPVTGNDLISKGIAPGPKLGDVLASLEKKWLDGNFNASKDDLLKTLASDHSL